MIEIHDFHGMSEKLIHFNLIHFNLEQNKSELHSANIPIKINLYVYLYLPLLMLCEAMICPMHIYHTKLKHDSLYFYNLVEIKL